MSLGIPPGAYVSERGTTSTVYAKNRIRWNQLDMAGGKCACGGIKEGIDSGRSFTKQCRIGSW